VAAFKRLLLLLRFLELLEVLWEHDRHVKHFVSVLLFLDSPFTVFFVETVPVVVDLFFELNVADFDPRYLLRYSIRRPPKKYRTMIATNVKSIANPSPLQPLGRNTSVMMWLLWNTDPVVNK
jgi:hypothetical protein